MCPLNDLLHCLFKIFFQYFIFSGLFFDMTGNYDATFVVAGGEFLIAAFLLLLLKLL
jgi:hypothetical protein